MFHSIRRNSSSSSSSSASGSSSGSGDDDEPIGPTIEAQVAKLKELTKKSRPIYEDYMPTSPAESPAATDSDASIHDDTEQTASKFAKKIRRDSSSDNDSGLDRLDEDDVRRQLAKISSYLEANAGKSGKKKKVQLSEKGSAGKEAADNKKKKQTPQGQDEQNEEKKEGSKVKKQKVIVYSGNATSGKRNSSGLTFKQRKSLQTSLSQLTKITEKIVGIAKDA